MLTVEVEMKREVEGAVLNRDPWYVLSEAENQGKSLTRKGDIRHVAPSLEAMLEYIQDADDIPLPEFGPDDADKFDENENIYGWGSREKVFVVGEVDLLPGECRDLSLVAEADE